LPASSPVKRTPEGKRRAQNVTDFIERLTVPSGKGQGQQFKLLPWQKKFIRDIYEPHRSSDGRRAVRRAILSMARKNGKTALIATIALAHLVGPEAIVHGEIYSAANDRDQAAIVFKFARQIVELEPELRAEIEVVPSTKTMIGRRTGSVYRAISAEEPSTAICPALSSMTSWPRPRTATCTMCWILRSARATSRCLSPSPRSQTIPSTC
jgi:phage terminase large subunit-like protein